MAPLALVHLVCVVCVFVCVVCFCFVCFCLIVFCFCFVRNEGVFLPVLCFLWARFGKRSSAFFLLTCLLAFLCIQCVNLFHYILVAIDRIMFDCVFARVCVVSMLHVCRVCLFWCVCVFGIGGCWCV